MWLTPCATDFKGPGKTPRDRLDHAVNGQTKSATYLTPRVNSLCGGSGSYGKIKNNPDLSEDEKRALVASAGRGTRYDTPTVHGDGGSGRNGAMPKYGQLNPDWVEWLMFWPVGWTDLDCPDSRLVWLDPSTDPADFEDGARIQRITTRRENRLARIKECGNGQFPLTAVIAFHWGRIVLCAADFKEVI